MRNDERANRANAAVTAYIANGNVDVDCAVQDLISDLLHLAASQDEDAELVIRRAVMNFEAEQAEDAVTCTCDHGSAGCPVHDLAATV